MIIAHPGAVRGARAGDAVAQSGHPATVGMDELRRLVVEPMRARSHRLRFVEGPRPGARGRRTGHGKRRKR